MDLHTLTDLEPFVCRPDASIRTVMERLNGFTKVVALPHPFLLVVDADGRLVGTITDGDIRRALLRNVALDGSAGAVMHGNPITGRIGAEIENRVRLRDVAIDDPFLPLIDDSGVLRAVLVSMGWRDALGSALVMAGGFGKRLGSRTENTPKPLLEVGGRPILEHILARLEAAGVGRIFVAVHYLHKQIEQFVACRRSIADVSIIHESNPLGTAGSIGAIPADTGGNLLVINADLLTDTNFRLLSDFHERRGYDATITVATFEVRIPYGVVRHNADGLFAGIEEKPKQTAFVAAGIYVLSPQVVALVNPGARLDMPDLLNRAHGIGLRIGVFPVHEYWRDVGQPGDLEAAEDDYRARS
ncbi:MAG: CBS domain-containing protein [Alphaproteobacteria bacterium]|nr:CBS domain-containing protein [Alphaproteobacteria bacterium]